MKKCNFKQAFSVKSNVTQQWSDQQLIAGTLSGDVSKFEVLVNRHKHYAYSIAIGIIQNEQDAEEVAHDAFLKAYKSLQTFRNKSKFTTWLYRIVFNTAISRKRGNQVNSLSLTDGYEVEEQAPGAMDGLLAQDRKRYISNAMNSLKPMDASLITLFYLKQLSLQEMTEVTGIDASNLKVKLFRARIRLVKVLNKLLKNEVHELL